jgi:putative flippase GtrA
MTTATRVGRFNVASGVGIGVQLAMLWMLVHVLHVQYLIATPLAVGVTVLHNFLWHWKWTWNDRQLSHGEAVVALVRFAATNGLLSLVGNVVLMAALVRLARVPPLAANLLAIGVCGLVNFVVADRRVFQATPLTTKS